MRALRWMPLLVACWPVTESALGAACESPIHFDIAAQPVDRALLHFAQQAGVSALFPADTFGELVSNPIAGAYCVGTALDILLAGLGVQALLDDSGQMVIQGPASRDIDHAAESAPPASDAPVPGQGFAGQLFAAFSTLFEDREQPGERNPQLEEITVTGSRLRQVTGMTEPTPVTSVSRQELESFNPSSTVAEQLNILPQFFSTQTAQRGGTTFIDAGGSYLNLRGMGPNRTLVLLNGSRVIPSDSFGNVNIDNFPQALLRSVDIVTGGASAAYGADAISGVVNFVLDRDFEGLRATFSTGATQRRDGENWNLSLAGGTRISEGLHVVASVEARYIDQIDPDPDRLDNWRDWGHIRNPQWQAQDPPGSQPQRLTRPHVYPTTYSPQGLITTPDFKYTHYTFSDDGTSIRPYRFGELASLEGPGATHTQSGGAEYPTWRHAVDGGPDSNEVVQRSMFLGVKYDISANLELYGQVIAGRTESNSWGRRGHPALDGIWSASIYRENPWLPEELRLAMLEQNLDSITVSKRGTVYGEGLGNYYDDRHNRNISQLESFSAGFNAALSAGWNLRGSYQGGQSKVHSGAVNMLRLDNFFMALDAVPDPDSGEVVCHVSVTSPSSEQLKAAVAGKLLPSPLSLLGIEVDSPLGPMNFADCVPINIFGLGNVSAEAKAWVEDEEKKNYRTLEQDFYELILTGDLWTVNSAGPVSLAIGLTSRREAFSQRSVPTFGERGLANAPELGIRGIPGGFTGSGNRSLHQFSALGVGSGKMQVNEWFTEISVPLMKFGEGTGLGSTLAWRSSSYASHGTIDSWKMGMDLHLPAGLRWRLTRSRDVREANFSERFVSGSGGASLHDPLFNETYVITSPGGPNPDLTPEKADTLTTGLVWQPAFAAWLESLEIALDWYEIDLSSAVDRLGPQRLTDDCFQSGDASSCALVQRNAETRRVDRVIDRYLNVGGARTTGVDLEMHYVFEPNFIANTHEGFVLRGYIGYLHENSTTTAAGIKVDAVRSAERPAYTAVFSAHYHAGPWGLRLQQRYYDSTHFNTSWTEGVEVDDNSISSQSLTSLGLSYGQAMNSGGEWRLAFNVINLFDREPPVIPGQVLANGHDQYGRRFQLTLALDF